MRSIIKLNLHAFDDAPGRSAAVAATAAQPKSACEIRSGERTIPVKHGLY